MMAVCYRYARSEDEAVELMNLGFFKVLKYLEKKPVDIPFKPWMRKVLINSMIDEFRKSKKYKENTVFTESGTGDVGMVASENFAVNDAISKLNSDDLFDIIQCLPEMTRKVFNLYCIDGYNHREIGEMLKITDGTSKWHLSTAKKKLREMILKSDIKLKVV